MEYNNGVRDHYEYKDAMFTNSLFKDFLMDNGLKTWKEESTRDLVCLEYNYGSRSYQQELEHLHKVALSARYEYIRAKVKYDHYLMEKARNKQKKINELIKEAYKNKNKYIELSGDEIRTLHYNNGVDVEYITRNKDGEIKKNETIHYIMLFRSTGKAKKGSCIFIKDKLYKKAIHYIRMGIKLPKENAKIVEIGAYSPLIASGIVGKVKINPKNILILKDVDRFFRTNVISVETDENKHCIAVKKENYELKNTMFDGQALIDSSIFPSWGNGYILLRHHFCKMAAFNTNIQKFFMDYFGDDYYSATVKDMFGNEHYVKDIELITTDNAMKWMKFDISYDYWCEWVYKNECQFGIVKTAHESKLGAYQRMSYQMVNSLDDDIMESVVHDSVEYLNKLKTDDDFFINYLRKNSNFSNDYEALVYLCENVQDFNRSEYFRERKNQTIKTYMLNLKSGKVINNADNLTIVGSPYAMLLYSAKGIQDDVDKDTTFCYEKGTIQCYTERFADGEYLAGFRSPFNGKYNLSYMHNVYDDLYKKYFKFGKNIIAVNMNGTDFQDRNNGSDQDSDFMYVTNHQQIVEYAKYCYNTYHTIVNNIPTDKNIYSNTMDDFARVDNNLSASQIDIGTSSNIAQVAQTYACNFADEKFNDYICIMSVLAQIAIDSAKRLFDVDVAENIKLIKKDMDVRKNKYPKFWSVVKPGFNKKNINMTLKCPMNYLYDLQLGRINYGNETLPMSYYFQKFTLEKDKKSCKKVEELIDKYLLETITEISDGKDTDYLLLRSDFDELIKKISETYISSTYVGLFSWLIDRAFIITPKVNAKRNDIKSNISRNKSLLIKILYEVNKSNLLKIFSKK